ncbi:MAG: alkyl sulfatase C-terminal domain-containing protein [Candidatus Helarchaeota archaeon]
MSNFYYGVAARIMMAIMAYATEEISKIDSKFKDLIRDEKLVVQWTVEQGGQCAYYRIENGEFIAKRDQKHPNPDIIISIKDPKLAVKILRGSEELLQKEVDAGNVTVTGEESKIEHLRPILTIISDYLKDLRD